VPSTHVHYDKQGRVEVPGRRILRIVLIVVAVGLGLAHRRIYGYRDPGLPSAEDWNYKSTPIMRARC
jgi:hypothetical protein